MAILLVAGSFVLPVLMYIIQRKWSVFQLTFNVIALFAILVFGNISLLSIYEIIQDNTVMMLNIHAIFLNSWFLMTGAYLGLFMIYRLLKMVLEG